MDPAWQEVLNSTCHPLIDGLETSYGYKPSLAAGIVFCVLFGLSMAVHTFQFAWSRQWWCCVFAIGCLTEVLGWAARTWSAVCPYQPDAFLMQISTLIIAPTFFTAGVYILLGRMIQILGPESSFLRPKSYLWIFCTCDIISLVVQAAGGGLASSESGRAGGNTEPGTNTMVAGIIFQMVAITAFVVCGADFLRRSRRPHLRARFTRGMTYLLAATVFSVVCIYVRSIYRTIELLEGWRGYLITHEWFFIGLDGITMVLAVAVYNLVHPAWFMPPVEGAKLASVAGDDDDIMLQDVEGRGSR
ncbi:RTA1 domain-containing protein [Aspergillus clavatus NRRL 1]|uniref:RTA1 domain protein, putative n=1 Tax=Aspergillus clavatus (strain ATCC 1007 / CBS 513.65 / DSM 816 / NCTC 3887 / NRRL 1 / QM 1276 / 107) TaxID=344612 RepID=A1C8R1_ASPCL|nr:RTA1 domain protein, putative [Aspergillus clavatus NRRL 1]EAW13698.1 RTA1 domain protein, putative [Aspergillus clavatus NRRL 1]